MAFSLNFLAVLSPVGFSLDVESLLRFLNWVLSVLQRVIYSAPR